MAALSASALSRSSFFGTTRPKLAATAAVPQRVRRISVLSGQVGRASMRQSQNSCQEGTGWGALA